MKILKSPYINPFGGINFVFEYLDKLGLEEILDQQLDPLSPRCTYYWKDLFYSLFAIPLCGGSSIEDIGGNLKKMLSDIPYFNVPSPDRLLDRMQQLATVSLVEIPKRGRKYHTISTNAQVNELLLKVLLLTDLDPNDPKHILDYDNTLLFTKKKSSTPTYKKQKGYNPGVAFIGDKVVYIENRTGHSPAGTFQSETLERMFDLFNKHDIKIDTFRADSASYKLDVLTTVVKHTNRFFIACSTNASLLQAAGSIEQWEHSCGDDGEYGETTYIPFESAKRKNKSEVELEAYRLIVKRIPRKDKQADLFSGKAYKYLYIITNDKELTTKEVKNFYNQRGAAEREFDVLKNSFGWKSMPFSDLSSNTVYLILMAICRNLYGHIIKVFSKKTSVLKSTDRMKKFIFRFISIPAKWVKSGRQKCLRIYGDPPWDI